MGKLQVNGNISATGTISATNGFSGNLTGNATTASKWLTARTLTLTGGVQGAVSMDGSGNMEMIVTNSFASNRKAEAASGYHLIKINSPNAWMTAFTVRLYQAYKYTDIVISGYNYGSSYWYSPAATMLGSSTNTSITVTFGYTSAYNLWVAIPASNYFGIQIIDVTNAYQGFDSWKDLFTITHVSSLPSTTQTTVTCYRPWYRNETVTNAANASYATNAANATYATSAGSATNVAWSGITSKPSTFTPSSHTHSYLPLSGGTLTGALNVNSNITINQTNGSGYGIALYGGVAPSAAYGIMFATTGNFGQCGAVTGDWATYFTMGGAINRGWIFKHDGSNVASISSSGIFAGAAFTNGSSYHLHPGGGVYVCNTPSITGYLKITLPVGWTNTMFRFDINIYDYSGQDAVTYTVGGYNYSDSPGWYNISAESRGFGAHANLPVTFGYASSRCAIYIGTSSTKWSYPQVNVSNVLTGYANYSATWSGSWSIGFTTSGPSYASTIYNPNVTARTVNYGGTLPSSGYHAGAIFYKT